MGRHRVRARAGTNSGRRNLGTPARSAQREPARAACPAAVDAPRALRVDLLYDVLSVGHVRPVRDGRPIRTRPGWSRVVVSKSVSTVRGTSLCPASWPRRDGSALPEPQARNVRSQAMPLATPTCMDTHPRRAEPYRERRNSSRWFTDDHSIGSDVPRDLRRRVAYSAQALELSHVCPARPGSGHRSSGLS